MLSAGHLFGVSLAKCEIDGLEAPDLAALADGMVLRVLAPPIHIEAHGRDMARPAVRNTVARMLSTIAIAHDVPFEPLEGHVAEGGCDLVVTDGCTSFEITVLTSDAPVLVWGGKALPIDTDLFLVKRTEAFLQALQPRLPPRDVICFSPGTMIRTPEGNVDIDHLRPGHIVQTRDDGPQAIEWMGAAKITPAGLRAHPHLRPIRIKAGALGGWDPDSDLLISPAHRLLLRGPAARALFDEPEVLVAARDLVNNADIHVDHGQNSHRYIHMMLPRHGVVWANGLEVETFHPADMALGDLAPAAREALVHVRPELAADPFRYGAAARRCLAPAEAAILMSEGGPQICSHRLG